MDEAQAVSDIQTSQELLDNTATRSKNKKEKPDEQCITFQNLQDYTYIMWQSEWELDCDKMKGLYDFHFSIPSFIVDDAIFN